MSERKREIDYVRKGRKKKSFRAQRERETQMMAHEAKQGVSPTLKMAKQNSQTESWDNREKKKKMIEKKMAKRLQEKETD